MKPPPPPPPLQRRGRAREYCPTPGKGACKDWCGTHCAPLCCLSDQWLRRKAAQLQVNGETIVNASVNRPRRRVMLWQGEKNQVGRLAYMYWPVMGTLVEGFRHASDVDILGPGVGFSLAYHHVCEPQAACVNHLSVVTHRFTFDSRATGDLTATPRRRACVGWDEWQVLPTMGEATPRWGHYCLLQHRAIGSCAM